MNDRAGGTSGGKDVTSGPAPRRVLQLAFGFLAFATINALANASSMLADFARAGSPETAVHVWSWELTSLASWLMLFPVIWRLVARIRPPRIAWYWTALAHVLATVPISVAHVAIMVGLRMAVYALMGETYVFDLPSELLYEYRKDAVSYVMLSAYAAFAQWYLAWRRPVPERAAPEVLLVPDGSVTHRIPISAIDWVSAAGNYVELAWGGRVLLHRSSLAALGDRLGPDFVRVHRGRLVRRGAIRRIATDRSGDFTVTLESGATLRGSRRYRAGLDAKGG